MPSIEHKRTKNDHNQTVSMNCAQKQKHDRGFLSGHTLKFSVKFKVQTKVPVWNHHPVVI